MKLEAFLFRKGSTIFSYVPEIFCTRYYLIPTSYPNIFGTTVARNVHPWRFRGCVLNYCRRDFVCYFFVIFTSNAHGLRLRHV